MRPQKNKSLGTTPIVERSRPTGMRHRPTVRILVAHINFNIPALTNKMDLRTRTPAKGKGDKIPSSRSSSQSMGSEMECETTPKNSSEERVQQEGMCRTGGAAEQVTGGNEEEAQTAGDDNGWGPEKEEWVVASSQGSEGTLQPGESRTPMESARF